MINCYYIFQTFLVIKNDDEYQFIKFKKYKNASLSETEKEERRLLKQGYQPLSYYFDG